MIDRICSAIERAAVCEIQARKTSGLSYAGAVKFFAAIEKEPDCVTVSPAGEIYCTWIVGGKPMSLKFCKDGIKIRGHFC